MAAGIKKHGHVAIVTRWENHIPADVAVGYGWKFPHVLTAHKRFVYVDLGWWGRKPKRDELNGYHKVVVNGREPTDYFDRASLPDRFDRFGLELKPWRKGGDHILLAGMSEKSSGTRGFRPLEWEMNAIDKIKRVTDTPIVYRPKPSWKNAKPIDGTVFSPPTQPLSEVLENCAGVVTLHSNVAVDALIAGVPVLAEQGVASLLSVWSIERLLGEQKQDRRQQLMDDVAYCQWTPTEMASGECWEHLVRETPLCA